MGEVPLYFPGPSEQALFCVAEKAMVRGPRSTVQGSGFGLLTGDIILQGFLEFI